jgi:hypothetical protein
MNTPDLDDFCTDPELGCQSTGVGPDFRDDPPPTPPDLSDIIGAPSGGRNSRIVPISNVSVNRVCVQRYIPFL